MATQAKKSISLLFLVMWLVISTPLAGSATGDNSSLYYETKLTDQYGAVGSKYGSAIAVDGDWAVIGAYGAGGDQGIALVYRRVASSWVLQLYLDSGVPGAEMRFGYSVAISGDTILIGAPYDSTYGNYRQGAVYVYRLNGDLWEFETKLQEYPGAGGDYFGFAVAIDGDTALVGAERGSPTLSGQGKVVIYNYQAGGWNTVQTLTASNPQVAAWFGYTVALEGNIAVVGAPHEDVNAVFNQGRVYVFTYDGLQWIEQQALFASDGDTEDSFGSSVDVQGGTIIVGAPLDTTTSGEQAGSAYVFTYNNYWFEQAKLTASDADQYGHFGNSVSLYLDTALAGSPQHNVGANYEQGAAYIYQRNGTNWIEQVELNASDGIALDRFGNAVKLDGNNLWVGAPNANGPAGGMCGAVYVYTPPFQVMIPIVLKNP